MVADHSISATFAPDTYTITTSAGAGGTISPASPVVAHGDDMSFLIVPDAHFHILDVAVDGVSLGAIGSYTFADVTAPGHTIAATFGIDTNDITASAGAGGTVAPAGVTPVPWGGSQAYTITPDANFHIADVAIDGVSAGPVASHTFTDVVSPHTIEAAFAIDTYQVAFDSHGGTPVAAQTLAFGSLVATPVPDPTRTGHTFAGWYADAALTDPWDFSADTVGAADLTLHAKWDTDTYTITTSAGAGGTISPASPVVAHGDDMSFLIVPDAHFHILDVAVDGVSLGAIGSYTFADVTAPGHTIAATFGIDTNDITASAGAGGTVAPAGVTPVPWGGSQAYTITPDANFHIADVAIDGVSAGPVASHTFTDVVSPHTIEAAFAIDTYQVAFDSHGGTPVAAQTLAFGSLVATPVPDPTRTGHTFAGWYADAALTDPWDFSADTVGAADLTLHAKWDTDTYTITTSAGAGGTISPASPVVAHGDDMSFLIVPDAHFHILDVAVDGVSLGAIGSYTFADVTAPGHTIAATFGIDTNDITASAGAGGTVAPAGVTPVPWGGSQAYTITPDANFHIADVAIDGVSAGPVASHTFTDVVSPHTIEAAFAIDTYQVAFDSHGGTPVAAQTLAFGSLVATPVPDPTRTGHTFAGWYADAALTDPWDFSADTVGAADLTLHAKWDTDTYTITTSAGAGGTISPASPVVAHGDDMSFLIVPDAHFHILDVAVDGVSLGAIGSYTFADVTAPGHTIAATFGIDTNDITASAGAGGTVAPAGVTPVPWGGSQAYTITPDANFHIADVAIDGVSAGPVASHTFTDVVSPHTIEAAFAIDTYQVTFDSHGGTPVAAQTLAFGSLVATPVPDPTRTGHAFAGWYADAALTDPWDFSADTVGAADLTLHAKWDTDTYTITTSAGAGGTISPASPVVAHGADMSFLIVPDAHFHILDVARRRRVAWRDRLLHLCRRHRAGPHDRGHLRDRHQRHHRERGSGRHRRAGRGHPGALGRLSGLHHHPRRQLPHRRRGHRRRLGRAGGKPHLHRRGLAPHDRGRLRHRHLPLTYRASAGGTVVGTSPQTVDTAPTAAP